MSTPITLTPEPEFPAYVNDPEHRWIAVCMGTGCTSSDSTGVREKLREELAAHGLEKGVEVRRTGCFGFCEQGPILVNYPDETFYTLVKPRSAKKIVEEHIIGDEPVERLLYKDPTTAERVQKWHDVGFYGKQQRILHNRCTYSDL